MNYPIGVNQRSHLIGMLAAIIVGGVVAMLVTTIIREAVRGQRSITDRDEMTEFVVFLKNVLATDATCNSALGKHPFAVGGSTALELNIGYEDQTNAVIKKGFSFAGGAIEIEELALEDRTGPNAIQFEVGVTDQDGAAREQTVRRHMARLQVRLRKPGDESSLRTRFLEVPVLVNVSTNSVEMCNNEVNIGDACQALGFRWDVSSQPPQCVMMNSCKYGGAYTSRRAGGCATADANPATGDCSCPSGYTAISAGSVNINNVCVKGCDRLSYDSVIQCFRCPGDSGS